MDVAGCLWFHYNTKALRLQCSRQHILAVIAKMCCVYFSGRSSQERNKSSNRDPYVQMHP